LIVRWLVVIAALVAGGALALAWPGRGSRTHAAAARPGEAAEEIGDLRSEVSALRAEVQRQRVSSWVRTGTPAAEATAAPAPQIPAASAEERLAADRARAGQTAAVVAGRFRGERPDPAWSGPAAARIEDDLRQAGLAGSVRRVECGSTMCQVALEIDEGAREQLATRLTELPAFQTQVLYQHHPGTQPPRLTVFVARAGHQLPLDVR
jgi:hypothetical protein